MAHDSVENLDRKLNGLVAPSRGPQPGHNSQPRRRAEALWRCETMTGSSELIPGAKRELASGNQPD